MTIIKTVAEGCMDCRLYEYYNKLMKDGDVALLTNAGADSTANRENMIHVLDANPSIDRVVEVVHDNGCGGMKTAKGVIIEHNPELVAYETRFKPLEAMVKNSKNLKELEEKENPAFQVKMLRELVAKHFPDRKISVDFELVHVPEKGHADHFLLITKDLTTSTDKLRMEYRNFDPEHAYALRYAKDVKEILPDISIAVKVLGLVNIKTIAVPRSDLISIQSMLGNNVNISALSQSKNMSKN